MSELQHDLSVLVSIAKLDSTLTGCRGELSRLPDQIRAAEKTLARVETLENTAITDFEAKVKERRTLETELQDSEVRINKFRGDLMQAGSNKEYQACQKEIANLKDEIDTKEERLLVLMDELDDHRTEHEAELKKLAEEKKQKTDTINSLRERQAFLGAEIDRLENEKPAFLREINPKLRNKYERLLANLGSRPAARVENESCGGCGVKLPPQLVVEVRDNDQLLICQACGRILIHYVD
jgi:predicted  nucleic acid-binding Zn-ribbon protein